MYEGVREKYNSRTEYNYFGMEKPLAYEIVDMARRFDQQKEELLDLVDMQARLLDSMEYKREKREREERERKCINSCQHRHHCHCRY